MRRPVSHLAFTMLELLVVISVMAVLASMILVGAKAIMGNAEKKKTETIIQTVRTGIELAIANKGSAISPTEHPFAGSRADGGGGGRFKFIRGDARWPGSVSTSGIALKGVPNPDYLGGDPDHLLMASDVYNDPRIVLLFGARRENIGVLQSLRKVVTKYRLLPMPPKKADNTQAKVISRVSGLVESSFDDTKFPDTMIPSNMPAGGPNQELDPTYGLLADSKPALDYLFGNSSAQAELAALKALYNADPTLPEDVNRFRTGVEGRSVNGVTEPLVYTNLGSAGVKDFRNQEGKWKPGFIPLSTGGSIRSLDTVDATTWGRYRLAGLAVYDAWGNELMTVTGANNSYRVISAGADGALAVDPGKDNKIDTTLSGDMREKLPLSAKDNDGAKDNLQ
jgi:prepilin-type N-terminal cleavage/methylation domain-containing protein